MEITQKQAKLIADRLLSGCLFGFVFWFLCGLGFFLINMAAVYASETVLYLLINVQCFILKRVKAR